MSIAFKRVLCGFVLGGLGSMAMAANGDLDTSFGTGGYRLTGIIDANGALAVSGIAVQTDGKILICNLEGTTASPTSKDFFVARFTPDGQLDTSFSFDGRTTIDFGGRADACSGIAVQADGKIVVAGTSTPVKGGSDFAVARLTSDGTLDTDFGAGTGQVIVGFDLGGGNNDVASSLALQADGKIVVVGTADTTSNGTDFAILRLNTDGIRDTTFNLTGRVSVGFDFAASLNKDDQATHVAIDSQGRIVVGGNADTGAPGGSDMAVVRLLPSGQLDNNFNADGRATIAFDLGGANGSNTDIAYSVCIQRDGRIVLAGAADSSNTATQNPDMAVARLLPDGSPDASFGNAGRALVAFDLGANSLDEALGVVEQSNGKLVVAGVALGGTMIVGASARLNVDGTPDQGWGVLGKRTYDLGLTSPSAQLISGIAMQGNQVVVSGGVNVNAVSSHIDYFVARLLDDLIFADGFE